MNLHDITTIDITALIWFRPAGGNGRTLGRGGFLHLYPIERGTTPYPLGDPSRRYWHPYGNTPRDPLNPICGPIRTTARFPTMNRAWHDGWGAQPCPRCAIIAGTQANYHGDLLASDPWRTIPREEMVRTPDPITGR